MHYIFLSRLFLLRIMFYHLVCGLCILCYCTLIQSICCYNIYTTQSFVHITTKTLWVQIISLEIPPSVISYVIYFYMTPKSNEVQVKSTDVSFCIYKIINKIFILNLIFKQVRYGKLWLKNIYGSFTWVM